MSRQLPETVTRATQAMVTLVAVGAVAVALTVLLEDQLIRSWAEGNSSVRGTLASGGLEAVKDGPIRPPGFVPVGLVLFLVLAGLVWVLGAFFRAGHEWARLSLAVLVALTAIATVAGIRTGPPVVFVLFCLVSLLVGVVLLRYLFDPATTAFIRGPQDTPERPEAPAA